MALKKTKTMTNGESGEYWKITSSIPNYQAMTTTYRIELFKDKSYSKIDSIKGTTKTFTFPTTKEEFASGDLRAVGYPKILAKANSVVRPAIAARAATSNSPAVIAQAAVYGDADIKDAITD